VSGLLEGSVCVVTGGAQGIGLSIAEAMVAQGARVVIGDLNVEAAEAAVSRLGGTEWARAVSCDVRKFNEVEALVQTAVDAFGSIDVMVNNAGITRDATMRRMSEDDFALVLEVHLTGCWNGTRAAAAHMREQRRGSIINVSSISAKVGFVGQTNYSAAKAGIVGMSKAAAKEVAHDGVRVNVVQPGLIRTAMTEAMAEHIWNAKLAEVPMQRAGEPSEVASVVVFLASAMSSYMTGAVLEITGGRYM